MKKILLTISILSTLIVNAYAQDGVDTTKNWTIKGENTFLINQSSFTNWAAGGVNSFAGNVIFNYDFNYKKDKWSWDNKILAAYGQTFQKETDWRKNDDRFAANSLLGYQIKEKWLYTFFMNFNTQFAKGYKYDADGNGELTSAGFAPAYLSFGPGLAYKESDNFKINISPASARLIFVTNDAIDETLYGLDAGKNSRFEFGASLDAYYKKDIMENIAFENILRLYSNYLENPQNIDIDYTANLFMKVNKFITVNAGVQLIYDDNTKIPTFEDGVKTGEGPKLQVKQVVGAGITYKF